MKKFETQDRIINLTMHPATPAQTEAGVVDFTGNALADLRTLLNFEELPSARTLERRARHLADLANRSTIKPRVAMIGGAPFLMAPLEGALKRLGIQPVYAFSVRESVETTDTEGAVRKMAVFKHLGFVSGQELSE